MAYSKAQCKATRKYNERMYDRFQVYASRGRKTIYQAAAAQHGLSLNAYILSLLEADAKALGLPGLEEAEAAPDGACGQG